MKKLKDLKENERVSIDNKSEAKALRKLLKKEGYTHGVSTEKELDIKFVRSICNLIKIKDKFYYYVSTDWDKCYPASDFIKPKKSTKKIIKELKQEVARLDNEVCDIKKMLPDIVVNVEVEKKNELEVGKWYKLKEYDSKLLACFKGLPFNGYGFDDEGIWCGSDDWGWLEDGWTPATHKEVEEALINEAKNRGFKPLVQIKVNGNIETLYENYGDFMFNSNTLWYCGYMIFNNGEWKEIVSQPEQIEPLKAGDWSITSNTKTEQEYIADYIKNRVGGLSTKGNIVIKRVGELGMLDEASDILKEVSKCINFHVSIPTDLKARIEKYCYFVEKNKKDE